MSHIVIKYEDKNHLIITNEYEFTWIKKGIEMLIKYNPNLTALGNMQELLKGAGYPAKYIGDLTLTHGAIDRDTGQSILTVTIPSTTHPLAVALGRTETAHDYTQVHVADWFHGQLNSSKTPEKYYAHPKLAGVVAVLDKKIDTRYPKKRLVAELTTLGITERLGYNQVTRRRVNEISPPKCLHSNMDFDLYLAINVAEELPPGRGYVYTPYRYYNTPVSAGGDFDVLNKEFTTVGGILMSWLPNINSKYSLSFLDYPTESDVLMMQLLSVNIMNQLMWRIDDGLRENTWNTVRSFGARTNPSYSLAQQTWINTNNQPVFKGIQPVTYNFGAGITIARDKVFHESETSLSPEKTVSGTTTLNYAITDFYFAWRYFQYAGLPKPRIDIQKHLGQKTTLPESITKHAWENLETAFTPTGAKFTSEFSRLSIKDDAEALAFASSIVKEITAGQHFEPEMTLTREEHNWNGHVLTYKVKPVNTKDVFNKNAYDRFMEGELTFEFNIARYEGIDIPDDLLGFTKDETPVPDTVIDMNGFVEH